MDKIWVGCDLTSARMHPTDHMSIGEPYETLKHKSSGARYQRVVTYMVSSWAESSSLY